MKVNIKDGSFQISGIKESDIITAVDVSYIEPTNHYKRETVRLILLIEMMVEIKVL